MHKSRLAGFIIDCKSADLTAAAQFWGAALGLSVHPPSSAPQDAAYRRLVSEDGLHIEVQQVTHASRVHLDIETDDIESEVKRLERLGAKRVETVRTWVVMEAPTGQRFCVVRLQSTPAFFAANAHSWQG